MQIGNAGARTARTCFVLALLLVSAMLFTEGFPDTIERSIVVGAASGGSAAENRLFSFFASGTASWYGGIFHGRKTANGEIFDKNAMTAAHRNLPFGTIVLVRNLANGKEALVRINDRGPFVKDRIIDLSEAAGRALDMLRTGTAEVVLYLMKTGIPSKAEKPAEDSLGATMGITSGPSATSAISTMCRIQAGSFSVRANAEALVARLTSKGLVPFVEVAVVNGKTLYRVLLVVDETALSATLAALRDLGINNPLVTKPQ